MTTAIGTSPLLKTQRLVLFLPDESYAAVVARFYRENAEHFAPWDPPRPRDFVTETYWSSRLVQYLDEQREGASVRFFARLRDDLETSSTTEPNDHEDHRESLNAKVRNDAEREIVAAINFTQIVRGPFLSCSLGYAIAKKHEGRGLMLEALPACIAHMFDVEKLHRISAGYVPTNERSGRLLRRLGFVVDGYARDYLFINGAWRDHVLTSLINPSPMAPT